MADILCGFIAHHKVPAAVRRLEPPLDVFIAVSYTHLRAHETVLDLVCRLLLEKKKIRYNTDSIQLHIVDATIMSYIYAT